MFKERVIVANLDLNDVTWAKSYLRAANENGIQSTSDPEAQADKIYIGDDIPRAAVKDKYRHIYFLGASSLPPSDSDSPAKDVEVELQNMDWADLVLVVSNAERWKVLSQKNSLGEKVTMNGFPLNISELTRFRSAQKIPKSLCFLGQTRDIKNIDFEICLTENLKRLGFEIYHLSSRPISRRRDLEHAGSKVVDGVEFERYWEMLARFKFFASTSFYESLSVSGLEASILGCTPVVPDHSGFKDWCPENLRYKPFDQNEVIDILRRNSTPHGLTEKLGWYDSRNYFMRINFVNL